MVEDLNGPKGGYDTQCKIRVEFLDRPVLVLREVRQDAYSAVARAAECITLGTRSCSWCPAGPGSSSWTAMSRTSSCTSAAASPLDTDA
jgi:hypothetical protein